MNGRLLAVVLVVGEAKMSVWFYLVGSVFLVFGFMIYCSLLVSRSSEDQALLDQKAILGGPKVGIP